MAIKQATLRWIAATFVLMLATWLPPLGGAAAEESRVVEALCESKCDGSIQVSENFCSETLKVEDYCLHECAPSCIRWMIEDNNPCNDGGCEPPAPCELVECDPSKLCEQYNCQLPDHCEWGLCEVQNPCEEEGSCETGPIPCDMNGCEEICIPGTLQCIGGSTGMNAYAMAGVDVVVQCTGEITLHRVDSEDHKFVEVDATVTSTRISKGSERQATESLSYTFSCETDLVGYGWGNGSVFRVVRLTMLDRYGQEHATNSVCHYTVYPNDCTLPPTAWKGNGAWGSGTVKVGSWFPDHVSVCPEMRVRVINSSQFLGDEVDDIKEAHCAPYPIVYGRADAGGVVDLVDGLLP